MYKFVLFLKDFFIGRDSDDRQEIGGRHVLKGRGSDSNPGLLHSGHMALLTQDLC